MYITTGQDKNKLINSLLKLYVDLPMMIKTNIDVIRRLANGMFGKFQRLKLKNDYSYGFQRNIDGYYINCVEAKNVEYIELKLDDKLTRIKSEEELLLHKKTNPEAGCTIKNDTERVSFNI